MTPHQWMVLAMFLATVMIFHPISQYFTAHRGKPLNHQTLPDLLHECLPNNRKYKRTGDYMAVIIAIVFLFQVVSKGRWEDFFDWLKILTAVYLFKSVTMMLTTLPDSQPEQCEYTFLNLGGCNDLIFSAHTAFIFTTILFLLTMVPSSYHPLLYMYMAIAAYFIISTRNHYSIDVLLGLYISFTMFQLRDRF